MTRPQRSSMIVLVIAAALLAAPMAPAGAVNVPHSSIVSANPADNTPQVLDGQVRAIAVVGDRVVVGGSFTQIRNQGSTTILAQPYVFAFNRATGAIDTNFLPQVDDTAPHERDQRIVQRDHPVLASAVDRHGQL